MTTKMLRYLNIRLIFTALHVAGSYAELCSPQMSTPNCEQLRQIEASMDATVNPCDDFYGYSCNNWERSQNSTSHYNNPVEMLYYQMDLQMISVMDSLDRKTLPLEILNDTYNFYQSCLNAKGTKSLIGYLEIIKPGKELEWPLLQELRAYQRGDSNYSADDWPAEHFDYYALLGQLRNYDLHDVIIKFNMNAYLSISAKVSTTIRPPTPSLLTQPVILSLLRELGFPHETALNYSKRLEETRNYWEDLPQMTFGGKMTSCSELKKRFPYFQRFLENIDIYHYRDSDEIDVQSDEYYRLLLKDRLSPAEKREVCNYIMLRWLLLLKTNTAKDFSKIECIKEVRTKLELPMNILYYGYIYQTEEFYTNADIATLFTKTRDYMLQTFQKYLGDQTHHIEKIKKILAGIALNVGNLSKSMSPLYFKNLFQGLPNLTATNYYSNNLNLLKQQTRFHLMRYQKTHFLGDPLDLYGGIDRPFYDDYSKTLILPFCYLQPPIYHHNFDAIFKWSLLGYLISDGLYNSLPYFGTLSRYSNIEVAFRAYANELKSRLQPDFTNIPWKQLFFLNFAQFFCAPNGTKYGNEYLNSNFVRRLTLDLDIFNEAFQCGSNGADN